jgi:tail tube protein
MLGGVASAQPDAAGNPTVWKHTFTPGDLPVGLTCQVGRTGMSGTTYPFTYHGCRVNEWELSGSVGEIATLQATLLGEDEDTATALAVASYPASLGLMTFIQGSLTVAGFGIDLKEFNISGSNSLRDDRYYFGSPLRKQPTDNGMREYTGELTSDFTDLTAYNRFVTGTEAALVLLFEGVTISSTYKYQTKVTANVRFDGETPQVGGAESIEQTLPFKCLGNTPATAITIDYQSTDTAP